MPVIYFTDIYGNFYKSEILEGNIFGENAVLEVFLKVKDRWVSLGEKVAIKGIRVGKPLYGSITVKYFYVQNQL